MHEGKARQIAYLAMMSSLAVIMGYVEHLVPFRFPIPGVKLGLANVVLVPVLYWFGLPAAFMVSLIRIIISGLLYGNLFGMFYSLLGTALSLFSMMLLKRSHLFSLVGVSAAGGTMHNVGQIIAAMIVTESPAMLRYLPVLLIAGDLTGCLIGVVSIAILKRVKLESGLATSE